jgi:hypothetical protein
LFEGAIALSDELSPVIVEIATSSQCEFVAELRRRRARIRTNPSPTSQAAAAELELEEFATRQEQPP